MAAPPPSKPDRRFSRIRLSSRWVLSREGAALRLVPKYAAQTFGITRAHCTRLIPPLARPRGHSWWFSLPSFCSPYFHLPAFPSLHDRYPLRSYYERSDSRQPGGGTLGPGRPPALAGLPGCFVGASGHSVSNHQRVVRGPPGCPTIWLRAYRPLYRLRPSLADSPTHADRIEFTADGPQAALCYGLVVLVPLLSTPCCHDAVTVRYRTALHRTEADFHRPIPTPSQAHERDRSPVAAAPHAAGCLVEPDVPLRAGPLRAGTARAPPLPQILRSLQTTWTIAVRHRESLARNSFWAPLRFSAASASLR